MSRTIADSSRAYRDRRREREKRMREALERIAACGLAAPAEIAREALS